MEAGMGCRSSSPGPDWTDVKRAIVEVEKTHEATVSVVIVPDGYSLGPTLRVSVVASLPRLVGNGTHLAVGIGGLWPCMEHVTMAALVHRLLYQLDYKIARDGYAQEELDITR